MQSVAKLVTKTMTSATHDSLQMSRVLTESSHATGNERDAQPSATQAFDPPRFSNCHSRVALLKQRRQQRLGTFE